MFVESYELIANNGDVLLFNANEIYLLNNTNFGNPDINYQNVRGYLQDSVNVQSFTTVPRTLTLNIYKPEVKTLKEYWDIREDLLKFMNPLNSPLKFRITRSDGTQRELRNIYPTNGVLFSNSDFTKWLINETIVLTANDPIWYNPTALTQTPSAVVTDDLVFPFSFGEGEGLLFGSFGSNYEFTITYNGQWKSYPVITLTGSYGTATLENTYTGAEIRLTQQIASGAERILTLDPSNFSIKDGSGNNKFNELSENSNIVDFYIKPFTSGNINITLTSVDGNSSVSFSVEETFLGI